jgi:plasmid maintenance system antidote protein VapI
MANKLPPITPGDILLEEFLLPMGISQNQLTMKLRYIIKILAIPVVLIFNTLPRRT